MPFHQQGAIPGKVLKGKAGVMWVAASVQRTLSFERTEAPEIGVQTEAAPSLASSSQSVVPPSRALSRMFFLFKTPESAMIFHPCCYCLNSDPPPPPLFHHNLPDLPTDAPFCCLPISA